MSFCDWCGQNHDPSLTESWKSICPKCRERYYKTYPFVNLPSLWEILRWRYQIDIDFPKDLDWSPYVIYVAETLNHRKIKIGYTRRLDWRLKNLARDYSVICKYVAYFPAGINETEAQALEGKILTRFADYGTTMPGKTYGKEWFTNKGELNEFVVNLRTFSRP